MENEVSDLLADKYPAEKAAELSKLLTSGTWTHDYPITFDRARELGLPVRNDMPENVLHLMQLYPQPTRRQPSVEYLPVRNPASRWPASGKLRWDAPCRACRERGSELSLFHWSPIGGVQKNTPADHGRARVVTMLAHQGRELDQSRVESGALQRRCPHRRMRSSERTRDVRFER